MRAILVSVDYADMLALTLPYNRHHFSDVMVVTVPEDEATLQIAVQNHCKTFVTRSFYDDGTSFNKWKALELALDCYGRDGWLCVMDADVLWPRGLDWIEHANEKTLACEGFAMVAGQLCTPRRRMWNSWPKPPPFACTWNSVYGSQPVPLPVESDWSSFSLHPQQREFAGYSQIFHASDPVLGHPPWHQTDWIHAGGADSFFQAKWPEDRKVRPPFEVLHLGPAGQNWFGRTTKRADGSLPQGAEERRWMSGQLIWERRRANVAAGRDQFDGEKIVKKL